MLLAHRSSTGAGCVIRCRRICLSYLTADSRCTFPGSRRRAVSRGVSCAGQESATLQKFGKVSALRGGETSCKHRYYTVLTLQYHARRVRVAAEPDRRFRYRDLRFRPFTVESLRGCTPCSVRGDRSPSVILDLICFD